MNDILVVGSVALDAVETPFGSVVDALGGSAVFFGAAACLFAPVRLVGVVGDDYPVEKLEFLTRRGVDLGGLERRVGDSFRYACRYGYDLNARETLSTDLGVFAEFAPDVPAEFRQARWVFLGNIDPHLQLQVLDQVKRPDFVVCDTMNYWIEGEREALMRLLEHIDLLLVNDEEARELSGEANLARAARWIQTHGPAHVVVKRGEHGASLFSAAEVAFFAPGYPLEDVFDPTGAGDAFAGGLVGHLAEGGQVTPEALRRSVVYGCALGSFACEAFGPTRLAELTPAEVDERVRQFREMTRFEDGPGMSG